MISQTLFVGCVIFDKWILNQHLIRYLISYLLNLNEFIHHFIIANVSEMRDIVHVYYILTYYVFNLYLETKNQWARDDPAFVVIQLFFLVVCMRI